MERTQAHYKKMIETPIPKLIITLAIPTVASMLISNVYNLVDTYFVGMLGVAQSGAVGIIFTLMSILQAVAFMFGHGAGSIVARCLAIKEVKQASEYATISFFSSLLCGGIFLAVGLPLLNPLVHLLGATPTVAPHAKDYAFYILLSAPAIMASFVLNNLLRYEGRALFAMIGLGIGAILNIFLNPLCIFTFGLGIKGAGVATMISQYLSFFLLLFLFHKKSMMQLNAFCCDFSKFWRIVKTGFPSLLRQGLASLSMGIMNGVARGYGDSCLSAMSIVSRIQGFMLAFVIGIGQGLQPMAGFSYQVKRYDRLKKAFYFTFLISMVSMVILGGVCCLCPSQLVSLFAQNQDLDVVKVVEIGSQALIFTAIGLMFSPLSICPNMLFQSSGLNIRASFMALLRSGLFFLPCVLLLPHFFGILGLQLTMGIADLLSGVVSFPFAMHFFYALRNTKQEIL